MNEDIFQEIDSTEELAQVAGGASINNVATLTNNCGPNTCDTKWDDGGPGGSHNIMR